MKNQNLKLVCKLICLQYYFQSSSSFSRVTLHVSDHSSLSSLDDQIKEGNRYTFNGFQNYYLINLPSDVGNDKEKIAEFFSDSSLSYNSLTFAFVINKPQYGNFLHPCQRNINNKNIKCDMKHGNNFLSYSFVF